MTRKILWSLWILVMTCIATIAGYRDGKYTADRWWQAHQATVTRFYIDNGKTPVLRVCTPTGCVNHWLVSTDEIVDSDDTICYDPTTGKPCEGFGIKSSNGGCFTNGREHPCKPTQKTTGKDSPIVNGVTDDVNIQIDERIASIKRKLDLRDQGDAWRDDALKLLEDCARVDEETFRNNHCEKRKKEWDERGAKLRREMVKP